MAPEIIAAFKWRTKDSGILAMAARLDTYRDLFLELGGAVGAAEWIATSERYHLGLPDSIRGYAKLLMGVEASTFEELPRKQLRARLRAFARIAVRVHIELEQQYADKN